MAYAEDQITLEVVDEGGGIDDFIVEPTAPYDTGDLWVDRDTSEYDLVDDNDNNLVDDNSDPFDAEVIDSSSLYVCVTPKSSGQPFNAGDWQLAATDDTTVNKLKEHFWHDENGAHVLGDVTGYRNDIDSLGMHIIDTTDESALAEFTATGAVIGKDGENKALIDAASFQIVDPDGTVQFQTSATGSTRTGTASKSVSMVRGTITVKANAASGATISYSIEDRDGVVQDSGSFTASTGQKVNTGDFEIRVEATDASSTTIRTRNSTNSFLKTTYSWSTTYYIPLIETIGDCRVGEDLYVANSQMLDFVTVQDTSGDWRYRQWKSGKIEAWYEGTVTAPATTTAAGNVYYKEWTLSIPQAIGFTSAPYMIISENYKSATIFSINGAATNATSISGNMWRATNSADTNTVYTRIYCWQN